MPEPLLALDVGTTTARAMVFSPAGVVEGMARAPLTSHAPQPGWVEQDVDSVWAATRRVIAKALAAANRAPADLAAIGVTTQRSSIVVWDRASGRPLAPMVIWSDLRGAARSQELMQAGFFLAPQQAATKLEAVIAAVSAPSRDIAWGNIDSYLIWKLTGGGAHATDRSQAWPIGYLDLATMEWNERLIAHQGLDPGMFPRLVDTWGPIAVTSAKLFGAAVPIAADIADQQSALIAHGETAKVTYGTSATLDVSTGADLVFKSPTAPPFILSSVGGQTRFCVEGMVLSAGSALDWLRSACGLRSHARFETLAASVEDTAGAAFLPALQGLGAPYGDPARRAALTGLSPSVSAAHLARAGLKGVAFRVREAFEHVYGLTGATPPEVLGVDGGLTANQTFLQIQADLLGRPLQRHAIPEATAAGAALAAARGIGPIVGVGYRRLHPLRPHHRAAHIDGRSRHPLRRLVRPSLRLNERPPMRTVSLGPLDDVSRLTLGGGGLGQLWGETTSEEAIATVHAAVDAGITLIDTAPMYRHCETVIGEAFAGKPPAQLRFTTKCQLGAPPAGTVAQKLEASLDASLAAMRLDHADLFFLHSNICEDDYRYARYDHRRDRFATPWSLYESEVVPALEDLKARGRIRAWGITGVGIPATIIKALNHAHKPAVVQAVANLLDSPGDMRNYDEPAHPRDIIAAAVAAGVGVMGIRAVQAGALCAVVDRDLPPDGADAGDYVRAAPYRALCAELGVDPAALAHRYALDIAGVDTVILGVKNRAELAQCVEAEAMGPLSAEMLARIEGLGLRGV